MCRDIDLSFCEIGPGAGRDCGLCLRRSVVQWTRLNLEGNDLGKDGANPIFWALRVNCTLTELLMSDNKIGGDFGTDRDKMGEHGNSLAGAIEYNYTLRRMDLARNDLSRECATCVAHALLENPCLVAFNFERNSFDAGAADQLATRLATDGQIKFLNLRCNHVSWTGAVRFAAVAMAAHASVGRDVLVEMASSIAAASVWPCSAALRSHCTASLYDCGTPWPPAR